jgi:ribosomal protein L40E
MKKRKSKIVLLITIGFIITVFSTFSFLANNPSGHLTQAKQLLNEVDVSLGNDYKRDIASEVTTVRIISGVFIIVGLSMTGIGFRANSSVKKSKTCQYCAETINIDAVKCRYCGENLLENYDIS